MVPRLFCSGCGGERSLADTVAGVVPCARRATAGCPGKYQRPKPGFGGAAGADSMVRVPRLRCPSCLMPQSFDEYSRGVRRCQLCEVLFRLAPHFLRRVNSCFKACG